jgi:hypothetical protein
MQNLKSLLSNLQPNAEDLFIKSTLGFKRDLNRLGLREPVALAIEQHLLNMPSLRLHDLLYGLCLLRRHYLVLCALQELSSCQYTTHGIYVYVEAQLTKRGVRIFCALLTGLRSTYTSGISSTAPPISLSI